MANSSTAGRWATALVAASLAAVGATATALVAGPAGPAAATNTGASEAMAQTWGADGTVYAVDVSGDTAIVGGAFTHVVSPSGGSMARVGLAKYSLATGRFDTGWQVDVTGVVDAVTIAGDTVYIGGDFTTVGGVNRRHVAAVSLSTGAVSAWAPKPDRPVAGIAAAGSKVYLAGQMTRITDAVGTTAVSYVARVEASGQGGLDRTWTSAVTLDARARAIAASTDGSAVFVGGDFTTVNGSGARNKLVKLSTASAGGVLAAFSAGNNNLATRSPVYGITVSGDTLVLAVAGSGGACTAQNATTGATKWSIHTNGNLQQTAVIGTKAYCGGHFNGAGSFGGLDRTKLAEVELSTGAINTFAPRINSALGIWALAASPDALVAAGDFTTVGSVAQPFVGQFRDAGSILAPTAPEGLAGTGASGSVALSWLLPSTDGGESIDAYAVYRATGTGPLTRIATASGRSFTDTTVVNGTTYRYAVAASNVVGVGSQSVPISATPTGAGAVPSASTLSGRRGTAKGQVLLDWTTPASPGSSPITAYEIYAGGRRIGTTAATVRAFTVTGARSGRQVVYTVRARNAAGLSPVSNAVRIAAP